MKISIITVCYNSEKTIADTFTSIQSQDHDDIEYIVVDGGSTDNTLKIAKQFENTITKLISEPDRGIYDAMNKGISYATGEIVGFLNSDDVFAHSKVISDINRSFEQSNADCLYGDILYVSKDLKKINRYWITGQGSAKDFYTGWAPPHPTFYVRRSIFAECGLYKLNYPVVADYEYMLRVMVKYQKRAVYLPEVIVWMRLGGISNNSFKSRKRSFLDSSKVWKDNDLKPRFYTIYAKMARKLIQYVNHHIHGKKLP
jgi:glycosyltransferase involved in cell wall biosynthesis